MKQIQNATRTMNMTILHFTEDFNQQLFLDYEHNNPDFTGDRNHQLFLWRNSQQMIINNKPRAEPIG